MPTCQAAARERRLGREDLRRTEPAGLSELDGGFQIRIAGYIYIYIHIYIYIYTLSMCRVY